MKKVKTKSKLSRFEWVKKNIVIVPVVAAILAGTFTSVRYVLSSVSYTHLTLPTKA